MKVLIVTIITVLHFVSVRLKDCDQESLCKCTFTGGGVLDISSLASPDNTPKFKDVLAPSDSNLYSYNPCNKFTEDQCSDAAVCILNPSKSTAVNVGDASSAAFSYNDKSGQVIIGYTSGTIKALKLSEIVLVCDKSACEPEITADGQQDKGFFQMTLTTVCACPDGCDSSGPKNCSPGSGSSGFSGGFLFIIIVLSVVIVYFVAGTLLMKFAMKKEGVEVIPNITFWRSLPVLIKNGVLFTVSRCRKSTTRYDEI